MRRLGEKPDTIERVFEIRDWMETIPMSIRSSVEVTRRYILVSINKKEKNIFGITFVGIRSS